VVIICLSIFYIPMENYKLEYLFNALNKQSINSLPDYTGDIHLYKLDNKVSVIYCCFDKYDVILQSEDSSIFFNKVREEHELRNILNAFKRVNHKRYYTADYCMELLVNNNPNEIKTSNNIPIFIIKINFNKYTTIKKKRYPNTFSENTIVNSYEWSWRYKYILNTLRDINKFYNTKIKNNSLHHNPYYYIKLFYRNFASDNIIYNVIKN
jgi:hypothetical protein